MRNVKNVCSKHGIILVITCASLAGCAGMNPLKQTSPCVATPPALRETIETETGFIVPYDEMGQITAYIEQLRQCVAEQ
jgi:hypothetical protein